MQTKVYIVESERGWGAKVDSVEEYDTIELAQARVKEYNAYNDKDTVPDWYMYATLELSSSVAR